MSKKSSTLLKIIAFIAGVAAVAAACYIFRDKIKAFFEKIELDKKFANLKNFVETKILGKNGDDFFDDAEFFDDDNFDTDDSNRGYTSINIASDDEEAADEAVAEKKTKLVISIPEETEEEPEEVQEEVKEEVKEEPKEEVQEETPEAYEYEGLSDVSEDEETLEEEASLEG